MKDATDSGIRKIPAALTLELRAGLPASALPGEDAARATALAIRRHLITDCPEARPLQLRLLAGWTPAARLLRPGWPLHRPLRGLRPAEAGAAVATLAPPPRSLDEDDPIRQHESGETGRRLLAIPLLLCGPTEAAAALAAHLDASAPLPYTPRADHPAFAVPHLPMFDEIGYLGLRSLSRVLAQRYYSVGLGRVWTLVEAALFTPRRAVRLDAPGEPLLHQLDGRVRWVRLDRDAWEQRDAAGVPAHRLDTLYAGYRLREAQSLTLLARHRVPVDRVDATGSADPQTLLTVLA
jgi:hypothetical protein